MLSEIKPEMFSPRPIIIAGPCSAETEEQVMQTAKELFFAGVKIFRAGIWKPRTKPGGFEGVGTEGLAWLQKVKKEYGMKVATEVATAKHVEDALAHDIDYLWVGARTSANPFAMQDLADALKGANVPVLVKNPVNPDIDLWIGAMERINNAGITEIAAIHRGFSTYEKKLYRNHPQWNVPIELRRRLPNIPIICDPSHIGGSRELISPLAQQAMDLNFDGLIIETHCAPNTAWSDKDQQITPAVLDFILKKLVLRNSQTNEDIVELRRQIDQVDSSILQALTNRVEISAKIGQYKKDNNITVLQSGRYGDVLGKNIEMGKRMGLNEEFVKEVYEAIHEESVRIQLNIVNE